MKDCYQLPSNEGRKDVHKLNIYLLLFSLLVAQYAQGQSRFGVQVVRGEITGYSKVNYTYTPTILQFESFTPATKHLDFVVQRQLNFATFEDGGRKQKAWEAGINLGVLLHTSVGHIMKAYVLGSTGPHFVSNTPKRQAKGFIFSDNFRAGVLLPLRRNIELDLCAGIRHISNAGLKRPNKGVDNMMIGFGVKYIRQKRAF